MIISVDLSSIPPLCTVVDASNFHDLKVVATVHEHGFISTQALEEMVDRELKDQDWRGSFEAMLEYAETHGWVNDLGQVRAHVEIERVES
jgi:hypothetical protein